MFFEILGVKIQNFENLEIAIYVENSIFNFVLTAFVCDLHSLYIYLRRL